MTNDLPRPAEQAYQAIASEVRDISSRIGVARNWPEVRDELEQLASKYELWSRPAQPAEPPAQPATVELPTGPGVWTRNGDTWIVRGPSGVAASFASLLDRYGYLERKTYDVLIELPRGGWRRLTPDASELEREVDQKIDLANYRGKCAVCCTACCDMLTDDICVACERDALTTKLADAEQKLSHANEPFPDAQPDIEIYRRDYEGRSWYCYRVGGIDCGPFCTWREAYAYALAYKEIQRATAAEKELTSLKSGGLYQAAYSRGRECGLAAQADAPAESQEDRSNA